MARACKAIFAGIVLALSFTAPVAAGPVEDAAAAHARGDFATAVRLWRPLAEQGYAATQSSLAYLYVHGQGVTQDYAEGLKWYRRAAEQGLAIAQLNVGILYINGQGAPQNYEEGARWPRLAADQGHPIAQSSLGSMYADGRGFPQDYVHAHMWLNLAAAQGNKFATTYRDDITRRMTPAQIAEAQKLAREWTPKR